MIIIFTHCKENNYMADGNIICAYILAQVKYYSTVLFDSTRAVMIGVCGFFKHGLFIIFIIPILQHKN
jgi:hypothetical protein